MTDDFFLAMAVCCYMYVNGVSLVLSLIGVANLLEFLIFSPEP